MVLGVTSLSYADVKSRSPTGSGVLNRLASRSTMLHYNLSINNNNNDHNNNSRLFIILLVKTNNDFHISFHQGMFEHATSSKKKSKSANV